jgi:hypothetical protein
VILQHPPKAGRSCVSEPIHPDIRAIVRRCAAELAADHGDAFTRDLRLKNRVAALLRRSLPPRPRRPGRPGLPNVTGAIRRHAEITESSPELSSKRIWRLVYRDVIPGWDAMNAADRKEKQDWLRERVRWRKRAAERRIKRKRPGGQHKR